MKQYRYFAVIIVMKLENRFPDLELSYETYAHKKVLTNYDVCLAIPTGKKVFAWFTYDSEAGTNAVYFVELNKHLKIQKIEKTAIFCDPDLALQTILYGTITEISTEGTEDAKTFFIVEDVYYYKGIYTKTLCFGEKMFYLHSMFENKLVSNMFALPYMCIINTNADILDSLSFYESICNNSAYLTHHIQFRSSSSIMPYLNHTYKKEQEQVVSKSNNSELLFPRNDLSHYAQLKLRNAVFKVKADIQADVYHLYAYDTHSKSYTYVNIAYIGSLKSSIYMNSLFRNIKENENIDYGEESEDEDTFQNVNPDKYVDLTKEYNMNCVYSEKFKKWIPVNVVSSMCVDVNKLLDSYKTPGYKPGPGYNSKPGYNTKPGYNSKPTPEYKPKYNNKPGPGYKPRYNNKH